LRSLGPLVLVAAVAGLCLDCRSERANADTAAPAAADSGGGGDGGLAIGIGDGDGPTGVPIPDPGALTDAGPPAEVTFAGQDLASLSPPERVRAGIVHVLEGRRVFGQLTPQENLLAATSMHNDRAQVKRLMERTFAWFPRLTERAKTKAGYLSGGEQQMLAMGRALMSNPRLLLLDEPSLGLAPLVVHTIFEAIDEIKSKGTTILLVEQNAHAALGHSDRAYVLETGRIVMEGPSKDLANDPRIKEAYLGE